MTHNHFSLCLFDLGNVIINFDFALATKRLAPLCNLTPDEIYQRMASWEGIVPFEEGKITPAQFWEAMQKRLNCPLTQEAFLPIWTEIFSENEEVSALVRRLLKQIPVVLISNTNRLHFDYCYQTFPIVREIGRFALSCEVGARKPDPRIYEAALAKFNIPPQRAVYVDDLEALIQAGKALGLDTILFKGAKGLEGELQERGLLNVLRVPFRSESA